MRKHKNAMSNLSAYFSAQPLAPQAARWIRSSRRLLGLLAWLLLALLGLTATGCRSTEPAPAPTATVVPFPTFTSTPISEPTATPIAVHPLPTALATAHNLPLWIAYNAGGSLGLWQAGANHELTTVDGNSPVVLSTDRQWIAFRRAGGLWAITADGKEERQLISSAVIADLPTKEPGWVHKVQDFAWLPDSHRLLWTTSLYTPPVVDAASVFGPNYFLGLTHDLYRVDVDTHQVAQLAAPGDGGLFYPSPDGTWIATVAPDRISLLRTDGSSERRLLDLPAIFTYSESPFYAKPLWAADSQSLVVEIPPVDRLAITPKPTTIWQLWTDGRAPTQLAHFVTGSMKVTIAPDLSRIGYNGRLNAQSPFSMHLANIDGADNQIFHTGRGGGFREWLPDSTHFVYDAGNGGATYLGHIDGRPAISLGSQAMQSRRWLDAKHFLFIPYGTTPDETVGLWLGIIDESGAVDAQLLAEGVTTFDFTHLSPVVSAQPAR